MATLTLKNVPDDLYQKLKAQAVAHRRSLNQEAIAQLIAVNDPALSSHPAFEAAAEFSAKLKAKGVWFTTEEIDAFIDEGRR